jgi:hypothetical protein
MPVSFFPYYGSTSAAFLITAIALARLDYGFRVLLPVLRQRTSDI